MQTNDIIYAKRAQQQTEQLRASSGLTYVRLDMRQGTENLGYIVLELNTKQCPKTCAQFEKLCSKDMNPGYIGSPIHRVVPGAYLQVHSSCPHVPCVIEFAILALYASSLQHTSNKCTTVFCGVFSEQTRCQ
jgi:hypothetical protein